MEREQFVETSILSCLEVERKGVRSSSVVLARKLCKPIDEVYGTLLRLRDKKEVTLARDGNWKITNKGKARLQVHHREDAK
jgi:hypothetical protein